MAEHEVMWIGRRRATLAPKEHPATSEACADCGCNVEDYVAAAGAYGSWLLRFVRNGRRERLVWNGKDGQLVLEQATTGMNWRELGNSAVSERDQEHFVAAVHALLGADSHAA